MIDQIINKDDMIGKRKNRTHRIYNYKFQKPDSRDKFFPQIVEVKRLKLMTLPKVVTLRKWCSAIEDQGELGSCTANAWAGLMQWHENYIERPAGIPYHDLSRLFIYYNERVVEGTVDQDAGSELRTGAAVLNQYGVCPEWEWPYWINSFKTKPTPNCYKDGLPHIINSYYSIKTFTNLKMSLANNLPFVFGFNVYDSFESDAVSQTGIVPMPDVQTETLLGGHAVMAIGYDDYEKRFLIRNSWGKKWGLHGVNAGYFTMPYDYLANSNLASDFWTVVKMSEDPLKL
jgi:C1A family cysteine protease